MKRRYIIISIIAIIILFLFLGSIVFFFSSKVNIPDIQARLMYIYSDANIEIELDVEESTRLRNIFNGKRKYSDNPSCGFSEDISIRFGDMIFCIARDKCPIVKISNKYLKISQKDRELVESIFNKYGCSFPCL